MRTKTYSDPRTDPPNFWRPPLPHEVGDGLVDHTFMSVQGPGSTPYQWRFAVTNRGIQPEIFSFKWVFWSFSTVCVRLRNLSGVPLNISCALHDVRGRWTWHPALELGEGEVPDLRFSLSSFQAVEGDPIAVHPFKMMMIRVEAPPLEWPISLELHSVEIEKETPQDESKGNLLLDGVSPAGSALPFETPQEVDASTSWILSDVSRDGIAAYGDLGQPLRQIPRGLRRGLYQFEFWSKGTSTFRSPEFSVEACPYEALEDDVPLHVGYMTYNPKTSSLQRFHALGTDYVSMTTTVDQHVFDLAPKVVSDDLHENVDFSLLDAMVTSILQAVPDTRLMLRVYFGSTPAWEKTHPEELCYADDETGEKTQLFMAFIDSRQRRAVPSLSSESIRSLWLERLTQFLDHISDSPWGPRCMGIILCSGGSEEWFHWYDEEHTGLWGDVGDASQRAYDRWRKERGLSPEEIPKRSKREPGAFRFFRNPETEDDVIAFNRFQSQTIVDAISILAQRVKECAPHLRVGTFYGYTMIFTGSNRHHHGGHFALGKLLRDENVDFLCAPTGYGTRHLGDGFSFSMTPQGSIQHHGKETFLENDLRTHSMRVTVSESHKESLSKLWGWTENVEQCIALQRRELSFYLAQRSPFWWLDLFPYGLYDDEALLVEFAHHVEIAREWASKPCTPIREVVVFVDEDSILHESPEGTLHWHAVESALEGLARMGVPFDVCLLEDLPSLSHYKMGILLNAWAPSEAVRVALDARRNKAVHVYCGPSGIYRHGRIDPLGPTTFAGTPVELAFDPAVKTKTKISKEVDPTEDSYGPDVMPAPWIRLNPHPDQRVLGRDQEGSPTLIVHELKEGGMTVVSSAPAPPSHVLRYLAELSGVFVYLDSDDQLFVSSRSVGVHAKSDGEKVIRFPNPIRFRDPFRNDPYSTTSLIRVSMKRGETRLFLID